MTAAGRGALPGREARSGTSDAQDECSLELEVFVRVCGGVGGCGWWCGGHELVVEVVGVLLGVFYECMVFFMRWSTTASKLQHWPATNVPINPPHLHTA